MTDPAYDWRAQPRVTRATLATDLRRLGLGAGQVVLVHSSLSHLGNVVGGADAVVDAPEDALIVAVIGDVVGGADAVVDALLDTVGSTGTVLFPTLTGTERDGPRCPPVMDVRSTPCWTGRIPETARQRANAVRSLHPTHSVVALGAAADRYTHGHEASQTPCDQHSPYYRLITDGGFILLLGGVTQQSNTTLHCLEELADVPYHLQQAATNGVVIDAHGGQHLVRNRLHLWAWARDFDKIQVPLAAKGAPRIGPVGQTAACLMPAQQLADTVLPVLREDSLYLLSDAARDAFRAARR